MATQPNINNNQYREQDKNKIRLTLLSIAWLLLIMNLFFGVSQFVFKLQSFLQIGVLVVLFLLSLLLALASRRFPSFQGASPIVPSSLFPTEDNNEQTAAVQQSLSHPIFFFNLPLPKKPKECLEEFFGRTIESRRLFEAMKLGQSVSIVSPERIGKTWLIHYVMCMAPLELGLTHRVGYLNAALPSCSTLSGFIEAALEELNCSSLIPSSTTKLTMNHLKQAVEHLTKRGETPILCIDEFERFEDRNVFDLDFFNDFRTIAQIGLGLIITSRKPLQEVVSITASTSKFFTLFEKIDLGPFTEEEAQQFIEAKGQLANFTQEEQAHMKELKEPMPILLQLAGQLLLNDKQHPELGQNSYNDNGQSYWQNFKERLNKQYMQIAGFKK